MKLTFITAIATSLALLAGTAGAVERVNSPEKLQSYREGGQNLVMATDPHSGNVFRAGCTQGALGFSITYGKDAPLGGNVNFTFQTKAGEIVATGVSLPQKGLASSQKSAANDESIAKAFQQIVRLGSNEHMVLTINLVDGPNGGDIGSVLISGMGSTKALRPILRECGIN